MYLGFREIIKVLEMGFPCLVTFYRPLFPKDRILYRIVY